MVARTPGYQSLKAAYIKDAEDAGKRKHPMRKKAELYARFQWTLGRAAHYAHWMRMSLPAILDMWEEQRSCWWFGHYSEHHFPKLGRPLPHRGIRWYRKHYKKMYGAGNNKRAIMREINHAQRKTKTGDKARWCMRLKKARSFRRTHMI